LGLCRGHQLLNVALGGTLYQDIPTQVPSAVSHLDRPIYEKNSHEVEFEPDSHLLKIYPGQQRVRVNSVHHQAVKDLGRGLKVEARSIPDGLIEAIRLEGAGYAMGLQWHPEFQDPKDITILSPKPLLMDFLKAAEKRKTK
jgi:putative glutamine amidotransferase